MGAKIWVAVSEKLKPSTKYCVPNMQKARLNL